MRAAGTDDPAAQRADPWRAASLLPMRANHKSRRSPETPARHRGRSRRYQCAESPIRRRLPRPEPRWRSGHPGVITSNRTVVLVLSIVNMLRVRARLPPSSEKIEHTSVAISTLTVPMSLVNTADTSISRPLERQRGVRPETHEFYAGRGSANETIVPLSGRESICMVPPRW